MFCISVADLVVGIENKYDFVRALATGYETTAEPTFTVVAEDDEIAQEMKSGEYSAPYCESIVVYRKIAQKLPGYGALVFHGAVIAEGDKCYAFTARSGVGKTTHIRNWLKVFGDKVHVLNGDKPILRLIDGKVYACATPWKGKENYGVNEMLPLKSVCFLNRAEENSSVRIEVGDALMRFVSQVYIPNDGIGAALALGVVSQMLAKITLFDVFVNMDEDSARVVRDSFDKV